MRFDGVETALFGFTVMAIDTIFFNKCLLGNPTSQRGVTIARCRQNDLQYANRKYKYWSQHNLVFSLLLLTCLLYPIV